MDEEEEEEEEETEDEESLRAPQVVEEVGKGWEGLLQGCSKAQNIRSPEQGRRRHTQQQQQERLAKKSSPSGPETTRRC